MSEAKAEYITDAMEMLGKGYEHPKLQQGFQSPNYTQTPNDFFAMLPAMTDAELRVTLVMIRYTFGYHRNKFKMGVTKLANASGLSRQGALDGARAAEERGTFRRANPDAQTEAEWELVVTESDQIDNPLYSVDTPLYSVEGNPQPSRGQVGLNKGKKELKKKGDLVDGIIEFSQMPGVKKQLRLEGIQSRLAVALNINVTWSRWERFIKYADKQEQKKGETVERFCAWLQAKPGFDVSYWPPDKMMEVWPQAFTSDSGYIQPDNSPLPEKPPVITPDRVQWRTA